MIKNGKFTWPILVAFLSLMSLSGLHLVFAMTPEDPIEEGSSPTGNGWTTYDGELVGAGNGGWAGYNESCEDAPLTLKFRLKTLLGGMHANINVSGTDRYAIGLNNSSDGYLSSYIFKQVGETVPSPAERLAGRPVAYNQTLEYQVDILSDDGHVLVFVYEADQEAGELLPVIDYLDSDPLPPGRIDFEALNESLVRLSNVTVVCPSAASEGENASDESDEPPDLGEIYFERPDPGSLV